MKNYFNKDFKIVIPARKNSKRFKNKNRFLLKYTLELLKNFHKDMIIFTTDDDFIQNKALENGYDVLKRKKEYSGDKVSMKDTIINLSEEFKLNNNKNIITLYLTYPYRKVEDIYKAINLYSEKKAKSLLCLEPIKSHPYMVMVKKDNWEFIINHETYRMQDYPEVKELSHYICIINVGELKNVNNQMFNKNTIYMNIERVKDIDLREDL